MRDIRTTLLGNVTSEPLERTQADGSLTAIIRLAVTGRYYDAEKNGFEDRKTEYVSVFARRALARNVLRSVSKGQPLIVTGRLGTSEWQGDDGSPRHSLTLQAEAIGHDLSFGSAQFTKPTKAEDIPDHDPDTGELRPAAASDPALTAVTGSGVETDDALVAR